MRYRAVNQRNLRSNAMTWKGLTSLSATPPKNEPRPTVDDKRDQSPESRMTLSTPPPSPSVNCCPPRPQMEERVGVYSTQDTVDGESPVDCTIELGPALTLGHES